MIWMVHISSACQYIHTFSTCTLHMQWNSSRIHCNKGSLVATDFDHRSWQMARATPTYPFSKHIGFSCIFQVDIDVSRAPYDIGNMDVAYAIAICCISTPKVHKCLECHCSYIYIYIDELALPLIVLLYASMIWMVHISSACQYIHTFSTCTLHMQWNSSRIHCNKGSLAAADFDHRSWHMARGSHC